MRQLNQAGEDAVAEFEDIYMNRTCRCFISPPCSYCTHEGNPINVEETPEYWDDDVPTKTDDVMNITRAMC